MSWRTDLNDSTGVWPLRPGVRVKITHPRAAYAGQLGEVVRIDKPSRLVWVKLQDSDIVCKLKHRSLTAEERRR